MQCMHIILLLSTERPAKGGILPLLYGLSIIASLILPLVMLW